MRTVAFMKIQILDYHKTQIELSSMDDELPLFIFVISQTNPILAVEFELKLMKDFLELKQNLDFEEKYFRNFDVL